MLETGGDSRCISEILQTERERLAVSGDSNVFSTSDIYVSMARAGAALICAIKCAPSAEATEDDTQMLTVIADGYAIKDGRLCGYIEPELSPAVWMLTGDMGDIRLDRGRLRRGRRHLAAEPARAASLRAGTGMRLSASTLI